MQVWPGAQSSLVWHSPVQPLSPSLLEESAVVSGDVVVGSVIVELTVVSGDVSVAVSSSLPPELEVSSPSVAVPLALVPSSGQPVTSVKEARTVATLEMFRIMAIEGMPNAVERATLEAPGGPRAATLAAAAIVVGVVIAIGQTAPLDYDETVYFGIAREIGRVGCPIRPEGSGATFLNNPPLVCYASALFGTLGIASWPWLRLAHALLWTSLLCAGVGRWARDEGRGAAALAIALLLAQPLFLREAALAKLDVPLAAIAALHLASAKDVIARGHSSRALVLTAALAVLVRYQGVLLACTSAPILWIAGRRRAAMGSLAGAAIGALIWIALATACGGDLLEAFGRNTARLAAADTEPWFRRSLPIFWRDLAGAVGPTTLVAAAIAIVLRGRTLAQRPALVLALAWLAVSFVFCSAIALKAERYFMPAFAAIAVLASSLPDAIAAKVNARAAKWSILGLVLAALVNALAVLLYPRPYELNDHYARVAARIDAMIAADDRVMLPYAQVAWLADRHYVISLFEPDAQRLLARLRDPNEHIELVIRDARIAAFHPELDPTGRAAIDEYLSQHFARVPTDLEGTSIVRRVSY